MGLSAPGIIYLPVCGNFIRVHSSHSARVPRIVFDSWQTLIILAPARKWTLSHASKGRPSSVFHLLSSSRLLNGYLLFSLGRIGMIRHCKPLDLPTARNASSMGLLNRWL